MKLSVTLLFVVLALYMAVVLCQPETFARPGGGGSDRRRRCPDGRPGRRSCSPWSSRSCGRGEYCYTSRGGGGGRDRGDRRLRGVCCRRGTVGIGECPFMAQGQFCRGGSGGGGRTCRGDWECRGRRERCCWDGCRRTCMRV